MPSTPAASSSNMRWMVVQQVPRPRSRAASMNDQVLGMIPASVETAPMPGHCSTLPGRQGMSITGTRWKFSAR